MLEKWKPIDGYEGYYEVSNLGRIKSLKRATTSGKILKGVPDKDGYLGVTLSKDGKQKYAKIHKLVARAFVANDDSNKNLINHKNEIKNDNRASNLEWCDAKYNTNYNNMPFRRVESQRKPVIAIGKTERIRFRSVAEAARVLGVSHGNISGCLNNYRGRKTVGGYKFEYAKE